MGWDFSEQTKKELVADLLKCEPLDYELQNFSRTQAVLWVLIDTKGEDGKRVICLLLERRQIDKKMMWGYKDISDTAGPCAVSCPLRLIDASTKIRHKWLNDWHKEVRAFWKEVDKEVSKDMLESD